MTGWKKEILSLITGAGLNLRDVRAQRVCSPVKFDELARYGGSVIVERTKGEISARCDREEMNYLALNLAHDIITDRLSVEEARKMYAETAAAALQGKMHPYVQGLQFDIPKDETGDPDTPALGAVMKGMAEGVVDKVRKAT